MTLPPVDLSGTIEMIRPPLMIVQAAPDQRWQIQIMPNATVRLTGPAELEVLRAGHFVEFTVEVDTARSTVEEKIDKLTIVTLSEQKPLGAFPNQGAPGAEAQKPAPFGAEFAPQPVPQPAAQAKQLFDIRGRLARLKDGEMTVFVPNQFFKPALKVELADDAQLSLDVADYSLARPGDQVQARGQQIGPQMGRITNLTVELTKPLGLPKKPTRPTRPTRPSQPGKSGERAEPPAAGGF
jgi:hypothetical protein